MYPEISPLRLIELLHLRLPTRIFRWFPSLKLLENGTCMNLIVLFQQFAFLKNLVSFKFLSTKEKSVLGKSLPSKAIENFPSSGKR